MSVDPPIERVVAAEDAGCRLDVYLARQFPQFSRAFLRRAIDAGGVTLNGQPAKAGQRLKDSQRLSITLPEPPRPGPIERHAAGIDCPAQKRAAELWKLPHR